MTRTFEPLEDRPMRDTEAEESAAIQEERLFRSPSGHRSAEAGERLLPTLAVTGFLLWLHVCAWGTLGFVLCLYVPTHKGIFRDFGLKLPWLTEQVIALSDLLLGFPYIWIPLAMALLVLDGLLLQRLRRDRARRELSWFVFLALLLVPGAGTIAAVWAVWQPMYALHLALSR